MTKTFCRKCGSYIVCDNPNDADEAMAEHNTVCHLQDRTLTQPDDYLIVSDPDITVPSGFRQIGTVRIGYVFVAPHVSLQQIAAHLRGAL